MRTIQFYKEPSGHCPVTDFLDALTDKQTQKIAWVMTLVEELEVVPKQYFKKLVKTKNIWEIRVILDGNMFRVLGFFISDNVFVATNGFQKKTQKTPKKEIILAEKYKQNYLMRL